MCGASRVACSHRAVQAVGPEAQPTGSSGGSAASRVLLCCAGAEGSSQGFAEAKLSGFLRKRSFQVFAEAEPSGFLRKRSLQGLGGGQGLGSGQGFVQLCQLRKCEHSIMTRF